ncbi:hypothetical protein POVCU2_0022620 [Plasmodium ovale curtisi]|uniref:Uncharacterized protein n=1 Tax=Plasmodium ovale curtisi TaxID=864141 RepID=A0A1A8WH11_PLAOA|nr:hypothetical protein POVCU2_0022620 [Plasmodium ovale curtisi]SBS91380.1 hypothetical protein POVCU1_020540 [Plasmodium ovale curtisi]
MSEHFVTTLNGTNAEFYMFIEYSRIKILTKRSLLKDKNFTKSYSQKIGIPIISTITVFVRVELKYNRGYCDVTWSNVIMVAQACGESVGTNLFYYLTLCKNTATDQIAKKLGINVPRVFNLKGKKKKKKEEKKGGRRKRKTG